MEQLPRTVALIAYSRQRSIELLETAQACGTADPCGGRGADAGNPRDLSNCEPPPTQLDDLPFFSLPFNLPDGGILPDGTLLFRITGLIAGATYTGSFALSQFGQDDPLVFQDFQFASAAGTAPVPEPGTLILTGIGMAGLLRKKLTASVRRRAENRA